MGILRRILNSQLCPKALLHNISEFGPVRDLFLFAKEHKWTAFQKASSYIVARGVRGREGVQVVANYCKKVARVEWESPAFVEAFVIEFDIEWRAEVLRTGLVSSLSHQEHLAAGLSGRNFVETLKQPGVVEMLFGTDGVARRLSPFFDNCQSLSASRLLDFYKELVRVPIALNAGNNVVQNEGASLLRKKQKTDGTPKKVSHASNRSYNAMDFTRAYSNILTDVFGAADVAFTLPLWNRMLAAQRKRSDVDQLLEYFQMDMGKANDMIRDVHGLNWTTFLVLLCEVRQEMGQSRAQMERLLTWLEERPGLKDAVDQVVKEVVEAGATSHECYCVRVCSVVRCWMLKAENNLQNAPEAASIAQGPADAEEDSMQPPTSKRAKKRFLKAVRDKVRE